MGTLYDKVAIVGHSTTNFGDLYEFGISDIANLAIHGALKSAKMDPEEIDSLYVGNAGAGQFLGQEHLGSLISTESELNCPAVKIEASGASGAAAMRVAAHGILTGYLEKVAIVGVEKMTSFTKASDTQAALSTSLDTIWESSMGGTLPGNFALMARAHMRKYGTTSEQLADHIAGNISYSKAITVLNKIDLVDKEFLKELKTKIKSDVIEVSANTDINIELLIAQASISSVTSLKVFLTVRFIRLTTLVSYCILYPIVWILIYTREKNLFSHLLS